MDDLTNSNNQTTDSNRLRLKKVKRPVNRTIPQSPAMPSATGQTQQSAQVPFNRPQGKPPQARDKIRLYSSVRKCRSLHRRQ